MNFFGMGPWEIMIILVAALIIFGPGKLPEVAGQAGRAVKDFRRMTSELSSEFEKTVADVTEGQGSLGNELKGMASQVNSLTKSVQKDLSKVGGSTTKSTRPAAAKSTSTSGAKSTTTASTRTTTAAKPTTSTAKTPAAAASTPTAPKTPSKADPLADMAFFDDDPLAGSKPSPPTVTVTASSPRRAQSRAASGAGSTTTPTSDAATDAVARARQRRLAAGYNSHRSP